MYKTIIIDDEPLACKMVEKYLQAHPEFEIVAVCHDGFTGAKAVQEHQPDILFLDVQMPKINGFEMLELLDELPAVIFTTAFDEYAMKAFENNAADYLLKPFSQERFDHAIAKYKERLPQVETDSNWVEKVQEEYPLSDRVVLKNGPKIHIIPYDSIILIEADDDYVKIYTVEGKFAKKRTLSYFEKSLPSDRFLRIHRSFLLNLNHLSHLEQGENQNYQAILRNGEKVAVSRTGYQALKERLQ
ncbi:MAG: response regulator [Bacteroidetes bacterium]|nr:MAG: response regulator [Bacteroidota bacterium]